MPMVTQEKGLQREQQQQALSSSTSALLHSSWASSSSSFLRERSDQRCREPWFRRQVCLAPCELWLYWSGWKPCWKVFRWRKTWEW